MLEYLLYGLYTILGTASLFLLCVFRIARVKTVVIMASVLLFLIGGSVAQVWFWEQRRDIAAESVPPSVNDFGYVGSDTCRACHIDEYHSWHQTFHRTMTQVANQESVLAPFDERVLKRFGTQTKVYKKGDEFFAELIDPSFVVAYQFKYQNIPEHEKSPIVERQIVMTTGSHQLQIYWFREPSTGELWQFPWRYRIKEKRWVHKHDTFMQPPESPELVQYQVWSSSCIECHSVAGQPHLNPLNGRFEGARTAELGIACEACHGPGAKHCEQNRNPLNRYASYAGLSGQHNQAQASIVNPIKVDKNTSAQICGACHSHHVFTEPTAAKQFRKTGSGLMPGKNLSEIGRYLNANDEYIHGFGDEATTITRFWKDGVCRTGGREYNGLLESKCHTLGEMTCLSCHSMHNANPVKQVSQLMDTNEACYQCHKSYRDNLTQHTHHAADSSGSLCYNCHMPYTSYGLSGSIRSHSIVVPKINGFDKHARLNACNLCHLDKTLQWAQDQVVEFYPDDTAGMPEEFQGDERNVAASVLWLLKGDAGQRVTSAWHMGWKPALDASGRGWTVPLLAATFEDPYSTVRFNAWRSTCRIPGFEDLPNEFDAEPKGVWTAAKESVIKRWENNVRSRASNPRNETATLIHGNKTDWKKINELLKQRDDSRMVINE